MNVSNEPGSNPATNSAPIEVFVATAEMIFEIDGSIRMPSEPASSPIHKNGRLSHLSAISDADD
jgi:hypothetical protein